MLPRVAALLKESDWLEVAEAVARKSRGDPLFGPEVEERFRGLRLEIEREAAGAAVASH